MAPIHPAMRHKGHSPAYTPPERRHALTTPLLTTASVQVVCKTEDFTRPVQRVTIISYHLVAKQLRRQVAAVAWKVRLPTMPGTSWPCAQHCSCKVQHTTPGASHICWCHEMCRLALSSGVCWRACADSAMHCKVIVADESHNIRTSTKFSAAEESDMTCALASLIQKASRAVLLSGTPSMSKPVEMFHQIASLKPTVFGEKREFIRRFMELTHAHRQRANGNGRFAVVEAMVCSDERQHELNVLLKGAVMIRRLKAEVLEQLPEKRRQVSTEAAHGGAYTRLLHVPRV